MEADGGDAKRGWLTAVLRTLPLWLTVLLLMLTRIKTFEVREHIRRSDPHFTVSLGQLCKLQVSFAQCRLGDVMFWHLSSPPQPSWQLCRPPLQRSLL
jgi:hypothetical protein